MAWKAVKPVVCVVWDDADVSAPTTAYAEDEIAAVHKTTPVESIGLLLLDDPTGVTIMTDHYLDGGRSIFRQRNFILRANIREMHYLYPRPRRARGRTPVCSEPGAPPQTAAADASPSR